MGELISHRQTSEHANNKVSYVNLIENFRANPSAQSAGDLIYFFRSNENAQAVADLAYALAESGARLTISGRTADIASTGGPSSLSTLLCPLFLAHAGFIVPKLGVQGRPAGGIDVMAQLPGFDISPTPGKVRGILTSCNFAHFLADDTYAPLDQILFRFRQELGAQPVRNLVVASILAKKLAVGVTDAGLEIRVFPGGNFGEDVETAGENARFFNEVTSRLKLKSTCFVTDCTVPYQPWIGRGEAVQALHALFYGEPSAWLISHAEQCWNFVQQINDAGPGQASMRKVLRETCAIFEKHLRSHGADPTDIPGVISNLAKQHFYTVNAPMNGFVVYHQAVIRDFIVRRQRSVSGARFTDSAGIELLKRPEEHVMCGEPVLKVRSAESLEHPIELNELYSIATEPKDHFTDLVIKL